MAAPLLFSDRRAAVALRFASARHGQLAHRTFTPKLRHTERTKTRAAGADPAPARDDHLTCLFGVLNVRNVIGCLLSLRSGVDHKLAIIAKLLE
jgi:hypothetical protein